MAILWVGLKLGIITLIEGALGDMVGEMTRDPTGSIGPLVPSVCSKGLRVAVSNVTQVVLGCGCVGDGECPCIVGAAVDVVANEYTRGEVRGCLAACSPREMGEIELVSPETPWSHKRGLSDP